MSLIIWDSNQVNSGKSKMTLDCWEQTTPRVLRKSLSTARRITMTLPKPLLSTLKLNRLNLKNTPLCKSSDLSKTKKLIVPTSQSHSDFRPSEVLKTPKPPLESKEEKLKNHNQQVRQNNLSNFKHQKHTPKFAWGVDQTKPSTNIKAINQQREKTRQERNYKKSLGKARIGLDTLEELKFTLKPKKTKPPQTLSVKSRPKKKQVSQFIKQKKHKHKQQQETEQITKQLQKSRKLSELKKLQVLNKKRLQRFKAKLKTKKPPKTPFNNQSLFTSSEPNLNKPDQNKQRIKTILYKASQIQNRFKVIKSYKQKHSAATKIQALVKGFLVRNRLKKLSFVTEVLLESPSFDDELIDNFLFNFQEPVTEVTPKTVKNISEDILHELINQHFESLQSEAKQKESFLKCLHKLIQTAHKTPSYSGAVTRTLENMHQHFYNSVLEFPACELSDSNACTLLVLEAFKQCLKNSKTTSKALQKASQEVKQTHHLENWIQEAILEILEEVSTQGQPSEGTLQNAVRETIYILTCIT